MSDTASVGELAYMHTFMLGSASYLRGEEMADVIKPDHGLYYKAPGKFTNKRLCDDAELNNIVEKLPDAQRKTIQQAMEGIDNIIDSDIFIPYQIFMLGYLSKRLSTLVYDANNSELITFVSDHNLDQIETYIYILN